MTNYQHFKRTKQLINRIDLSILGIKLKIILEKDKEFSNVDGSSRLYIQIEYTSPCTKTGKESWKGGKWYLSRFMTDDEIVKKCYLAFRTCIEYEVLEGFKVDNKILFNPHINFENLLEISDKEIKRT